MCNKLKSFHFQKKVNFILLVLRSHLLGKPVHCKSSEPIWFCWRFTTSSCMVGRRKNSRAKHDRHLSSSSLGMKRMDNRRNIRDKLTQIPSSLSLLLRPSSRQRFRKLVALNPWETVLGMALVLVLAMVLEQLMQWQWRWREQTELTEGKKIFLDIILFTTLSDFNFNLQVSCWTFWRVCNAKVLLELHCYLARLRFELKLIDNALSSLYFILKPAAAKIRC